MNQQSGAITETAAAFDMGVKTKINSKMIGGIEHVQLPDDCKLQSFERLMDKPNRIKAAHVFNDTDSFVTYFELFSSEGTRIFVDDKNFNFTTVYDCDNPGEPAWGDHTSSLQMRFSFEWSRFKNIHKERMNQKEFSEFLCRNAEYIEFHRKDGSENIPMDGNELLTMAKKIDVNIKGNAEFEESESRGIKKIVICDDSTASGKTSDGKSIEFPEEITLTLRVFRNSAAFKVPAFLRQRIDKDKKGLIFWIEIKDIEQTEEAAFDKVIAEMEEKTKITALRGIYGSRY